MKTTFRNLLVAFFIGAPLFAVANQTVTLEPVKIDLKDQAALQRGARNFVTYCLNCHNAAFVRYSHLTQIGLNEEQIKQNLMFAGGKFGDTMVTHLDPADAKAWLTTVPPDLTLTARVRSPEWLYSYMRKFYRDDTAPSGWNNEVFPNVAMPHVLHDLQGTQIKVKTGERPGHDGKPEAIMSLQLDRPGSLSPQEYDAFVRDLVTYLTWMGEPTRAQREQLGVLVLLFSVLLIVAAWLLKHEYWKDVK